MRTFLHALLIACSLLTRSAFAQMSGTYTVGPAGADYATIQEAWDDLEASSINGPVELVVSPGTYAQQLVLGAVSGVSATNTITLRPLNPGVYDVLITHGIMNTLDHPVQVDCDHVILRDLYMSGSRPAGVVGRFNGAVILVNADDLMIYSCKVAIVGDATETAIEVIGDRSRIIDNEATHLSAAIGYSDMQGILVRGTDAVVRDNELIHFCRGISVIQCTRAMVEDNMIDGVPDLVDGYTQFGTGIDVQDLFEGSISRNKIISYGPYSGIHINLAKDTSGFKIRVENNMISIFEKDENSLQDVRSAIGIRYYDSGQPTSEEKLNALIAGDLRVKHNSVYSEHDLSRGIYIRNKVDARTVVRSNSIRIVANACHGIIYSANTMAPWPVSDYNNVSMSGFNNSFGRYSTRAQTVASTGMEVNSITALPRYVSKTDLHIMDNSPNIDRALIDLLVPDDYDTDPRQHWDPEYDIGADEYGNLGLKSIVLAPLALPAAASVIGAYPNPAKDQLVFELPDDRPQPFTLHGTDGRLVFQGTAFPEQAFVLHGLANGTYIARFPHLPGSTARITITH